MTESVAASSTPPENPFHYSHSAGFPALLYGLGASLLISTYQAGKLVIVRAFGDIPDCFHELVRMPRFFRFFRRAGFQAVAYANLIRLKGSALDLFNRLKRP